MKRLVTALALATVASGQIHVDTDSGYFTDDGVALTMLLRSPRRADVKGISVVSGNVWAREGMQEFYAHDEAWSQEHLFKPDACIVEWRKLASA